jgi:tRNA A-37 threonylcarbamoyl transferase component Bud32
VRLLSEGRASQIFELADGRVLRRFKAGGSPEREARVMEHALRHGYPVPRVLDVLEDALVLEHVDGPTMAAHGLANPDTMEDHARTLARLHDELHRIPGLERGSLLHLDLHPENVLLPDGGPVVVDWTNARDGRPELDPAMTWVIMMSSAGSVGRRFAELFAAHVDVSTALVEACETRMNDRNVTETERETVRRLAATAYD